MLIQQSSALYNAHEICTWSGGYSGSYTGIPEISVPIWDVKIGNIEFPINLSYNGGGIKVDEVASWVGLGWSLIGNGSISRMVRGKEDNSYDYTKIEKYRNNLMNQDERYGYLDDILKGVIDAEPDLYILSFPGLNCKFIQDQNGQFITVPGDKRLKISRINGVKWMVTDDKGTQYYFEMSNHVENISDYKSTINDEGYVEEVNMVTTWYISKIIDNLGNQILFEYGIEDYVLYNKAVESVNVYNNQNVLCTGVEFHGATTQTIYTEPLLSRISFNNTTISFFSNFSNRMDLPGASGLSQIAVRYNNELIKSYSFYYSYFENSSIGTTNNRFYTYQNSDKYRLKLDSIKESNGSNFLPAYKFEYLTNASLPYRLSNAQDHWGYANGKDNREFVNYMVNGVKRGADKDINHLYSQAFTLNKITYPAGGKIVYEYEGNQLSPIIPYSSVAVNLGSIYRDNIVPGEEKEIFEEMLSVHLSEEEYGSNIVITPTVIVEGFSPIEDDSYEIILESPNSPPVTFYNSNTNLIVAPGTSKFTVRIFSPSHPDPSNPHFVSVDLTLKTTKTIPNEYDNGPGIRVRKVTEYSEEVPVLTKEFSYENPIDGISSGQRGTDLDYHLGIFSKTVFFGNGSFDCFYDSYNSYSNYPLVLTNGSHVGYSNVIEKMVTNDLTLEKQLQYYNYQDNPDILQVEYPFGPNSDQSYKRGLLKKEINYLILGNGSKQILIHRSYNYQKIIGSELNVYGIKAAEIFRKYNPTLQVQYEHSKINVYRTASDVFKLISDTLVYHEDNKLLREVNDYFYNSRYLLQKKYRLVLTMFRMK